MCKITSSEGLALKTNGIANLLTFNDRKPVTLTQPVKFKENTTGKESRGLSALYSSGEDSK